MSEEPEIQQVYQYSVWYDIWLTIKKWAPRVVAVIIMLYIMRYIVIHAPTWLSMTIIGFLIALSAGYFFVSKFFHVDYYSNPRCRPRKKVTHPLLLPREAFPRRQVGDSRDKGKLL